METELTKLGRKLDQTEIVDLRQLAKLPVAIQLLTGRAKIASGERIWKYEKGNLKDYFIEKGRERAEGLIDYSTGFLCENVGKRGRGKIYDYAAETLIDMFTRDYLAGYSHVDFTPIKYASKELTDKNGKKLLGKFKGKRAYFAEDVEKALGEHYEPLRQQVGMTREQFNWAAREYIKLHENDEYATQKYILRKDMNEDEHGKFESYIMKSLSKYKESLPGADEIYKVGMPINNARTDEFGRSVQKYIREDMLSASLN